MYTNKTTKKLTITGLCIALGIVLPIAFHTIAGAGQIFLPMHLPIIICGFATGPLYGLLCGIVCPIISSFATGMPPIAILPGMACELATYGFISGLMYRVIKTKHSSLNIYMSLIISMLLGRGVSGFINGVILSRNGYSFAAFIQASFVIALPGIVIQLILIPILVAALIKSKFLYIEDENIFGFKKRNKKAISISKDYFDELSKEKVNISKNELDNLIKIIDVKKADKILDIACGSGILDNALIDSGASKITGIDLSEKMIAKAVSEHENNTNIEYKQADFYEFDGNDYDIAVIFNAYPHFIDRDLLVSKLYKSLKTGGKFVILHNMGINKINEYTKNKKISIPINSAIKESQYFADNFNIIKIIDEENMFAIVGQKK